MDLSKQFSDFGQTVAWIGFRLREEGTHHDESNILTFGFFNWSFNQEQDTRVGTVSEAAVVDIVMRVLKKNRAALIPLTLLNPRNFEAAGARV
jgi:hypothetical protein